MQGNAIKVYNFIKDYISEFGYPPTVRELCKGCGFSSTSTAQYYLKKLQDDGYIEHNNYQNRAIKLADHGKQRAVFVPEVGTVTAGQPILATQNLVGYCPLPEEFCQVEDCFALKVSGDSMIEAGIYNGDKIIVKSTQGCEDGDIVVALIDDSATVKRFFKRNGKIILHPENCTLHDIVVDDVQILGIVIGLVRKF